MAKKVIKNIQEKDSIQKEASKKVSKKAVKPVSHQSHKSSSKKSRKYVPILALSIFGMLFAVSLFMLFRNVTYSSDGVIVQDVQKLKQIMEQVHKDCKIIDLEHTKNYIDFLTVATFAGSEVGAVNLTYPQNWKGPYLKDNPTVQEQQYIILKNKGGYYIVPGDGVTLGNGKTIGKDIILDKGTDIPALLRDPKALQSKEGALGVQLEIGMSHIRKVLNAPLRYI